MKRMRGLNPRWVALLAVLVLQLAGMALANAQTTATIPADSVAIEMVFGTDIDRVERTVIGAGTHFAAADGKVFCFTHIEGMDGERTVTHAWYHEGRTMAKVELPVRSPDWRTWSSKKVLPGWRGHWEVKVLDESGKVLAAGGFELE